MRKDEEILRKYPLITICHSEIDYQPPEFELDIGNKNRFALNLLQGYYLEMNNGKQASFLDDNEREVCEQAYAIREYSPHSRLIAVSSKAILFHGEKGFYSKGWGDLDETDAVFLGEDLEEILKDETLLNKLFDY